MVSPSKTQPEIERDTKNLRDRKSILLFSYSKMSNIFYWSLCLQTKLEITKEPQNLQAWYSILFFAYCEMANIFTGPNCFTYIAEA